MDNAFEKGLSISYDQEYVGVRTLKVKYTAEIIHNQLHEHKTFSSYDSYILENKINEYVAKLKIKYKSFLEKRKIEEEKQTVQNNILKAQAPMFSLDEMVVYLDKNQHLKDLLVPFTEAGYATMNK